MSFLRKFAFFVSLLVAIDYTEGVKCPTGYTPLGTQCFRPFYGSEKTWADAKAACEEADGHLASITSCSTLGILPNLLNSLPSTTTRYWIGASDSGTEKAWVWLDKSEVQLGVPFWGSSTPGWVEEPNGGDAESYCAVLDEDDQYYMHDEDCSMSYNYLCEAVPLTLSATNNEEHSKNLEKIGTQLDECPTDDFVLISGSCFYFHYNSKDDSTKTTYTEAESICSDKHAKLAVFDTCQLFADVVAHINEDTSVQLKEKASYWIGATDEGIEGTWYWSDPANPMAKGAPFWGSSYGVAEPNQVADATENEQDCAMLYRDNRYYIHDGECFKLAYPLCQYVE